MSLTSSSYGVCCRCKLIFICEVLVDFIGDPENIYSTGTYPHAQVEGMVIDPEQYTPINGDAGFSTLVDNEGFGAPAFHAAEHCESAYSVDLGMRHIRSRRGAPW